MTRGRGSLPLEAQLGLLVFPGEGAHSSHSSIADLRASPSWAAIEAAVRQHLGLAMTLDAFLHANLGIHTAPSSPVVTTVIDLLVADRWHAAGHAPAVVLGHSAGEVASAHAAKLFSSSDAIDTAYILGQAGAACAGAMAHARLTRTEIDAWPILSHHTALCIAALNGVTGALDVSCAALLSVTLCGPADLVEAWLAARPDATCLRPAHPWHHPMYSDVPAIRDGRALSALPVFRRCVADAPIFVSSTSEQDVEQLDAAARWHAWLTRPVDFNTALERAASALLAAAGGCYLIEAVRAASRALTGSLTLARVQWMRPCSIQRECALASRLGTGRPSHPHACRHRHARRKRRVGRRSCRVDAPRPASGLLGGTARRARCSAGAAR